MPANVPANRQGGTRVALGLATICLGVLIAACGGGGRPGPTPTIELTQMPTPTALVDESTSQSRPSNEKLLGALADDAQVETRLDIDMDGDGLHEVALVFKLGAPRCSEFGVRTFALYRLVEDSYVNILTPEWWQVEPPDWIPKLPLASPECDSQLFYGRGFAEALPLDFTGDGTTELALASVPDGCMTCDLDIGVLDVEGGQPVLIFERAEQFPGNDDPIRMTVEDGDLVVTGYYQTVLDPNCCPSASLRYRAVFDPQAGHGVMEERVVEPLCTAGHATLEDVHSAGVNQAIRVTCENAVSFPGGTLFAFGGSALRSKDGDWFVKDGRMIFTLSEFLADLSDREVGDVEVKDFEVVTVRWSFGEDDQYFLIREIRISP